MQPNARMMSALEKKHLFLLVLIITVLMLEPFIQGIVLGFVVHDVLVALSVVVVLLVVFEVHRQRVRMMLLAIPALLTNAAMYFLPEQHHKPCAVVYHALATVFFGAAVVVILQDTFRKQGIVADQIIAGVNGFLIAGVAWSNLYLLVDTLAPGSFAVPPEYVAELQEVQLRRFEFNILSFATLTGLVPDRVTPEGRVARTLVWMQAAFALFYLAVIIGLLVGLRMDSATSKKDDELTTETLKHRDDGGDR